MTTSIACPGLSPQQYGLPADLGREQPALFEKVWHLAGLLDDLADHHDFRTLNIGTVPVLVQNFSGELRAFLNICSHRRATLQTEACGNRPLKCRYHGWGYNREGVPVGIPGNDDYFALNDIDRRDLRLPQFPVATCGRFVFVALSADAPSLERYLGAYWDVLEHVSTVLTEKVDEDRLVWATDWKIGVESVLEVYHVATTHPGTFTAFATSRWDCKAEGHHSYGRTDLSDSATKWWDGVGRRLDLRQSERFGNYDHFFVFPNLAIGLTSGRLMSVQTYEPTGPGTCQLHYRLYWSGRGSQATAARSFEDAAKRSFMEFNRQVLDEDRVISETCHANMRHVQRPAVIGANEIRIRQFHESYRQYLGS